MAHLTANDLNIYKIARTIGHATVDLGKLCTSIKVNPLSKYKPMYINKTGADVVDNDYSAARFGVFGPAFTSVNNLKTDTLSLHDALPISEERRVGKSVCFSGEKTK
jgi:hypothetical protein